MSIKIKASYTKDWEGDYIRKNLKGLIERSRTKDKEKPPYKILYITQDDRDYTKWSDSP